MQQHSAIHSKAGSVAFVSRARLHRHKIAAGGDVLGMAGTEAALCGPAGMRAGAHGIGVPSICLLIQGRARAATIRVNASPMAITAMR